MKKACLIPLGATCRHGYVRKHGKCRPPKDRVEEIISGDWSGAPTRM